MALMLSIDVDHPDVEEFIDCKTDLNRVNYANMSVRVNDSFMRAVEADDDYYLTWPCDVIWKYPEEELEYDKLYPTTDADNNIVYVKKVKAKKIFDKLVKSNWDYAEPGILYWDRIQDYNLLNNTDFEYAGTNPCAEEPLPAGGSCLLGSINLSEFVVNPFTSEAFIDYGSLQEAVHTAVIALNEALNEGLNLHPLKEQRDSVADWRQIGLGTLGLADMFIKKGIKYGSKESIDLINTIYLTISTSAIQQSLELAKIKGAYPKCNKEALVESSFIKSLNLPDFTLNDIKEYGLYNSQLLTCAPTGSIGTMLETSTGVEPNFALSYTRKTVSLDGKDSFYKIDAKIVIDYYASTDNINPLPDYFVTSSEINSIDRIKVQAALQKYIDASISSTINLPKEATIEEVHDIYIAAWKHNLKGVTVYRSGCKREGILTIESSDNDIPVTTPVKRPKDLEADFYTVKSKGKQYIVLVGLLNNKPYEVFAFEPNIRIGAEPHKGIITKKSKMHYSFKSDFLQITELELANENVEERAATLYASMLLRHGVDIKYIIKTARKVNDNISSFSSAMCRVLAKYMPTEASGEKCPECGAEIINEGGCKHCASCGYSRCE